MLNLRQQQIVAYMVNKSTYITSKELSLALSASIRTIKSDICVINKEIIKHNAHIYSKQGKGYILTADNISIINNLTDIYNNTLKDNINVPSSNYERIIYIIKRLLIEQDYIKIEEIMQELYISRSTLDYTMKEVKKILNTYRLKIIMKSHYGIILTGCEINKRLCISQYYFHHSLKHQYNIDILKILNENELLQYNSIIHIIKKSIQDSDIIIPEFSINNFAIHIIISIRRCNTLNNINVSDSSYLKDTIYYKTSMDIIHKLNSKGYNIPAEEVVYYTMHIKSKCINSKENVQVDDSFLDSCINSIYQEIYSNFDIDLSNDSELYEYLYLHIPKMVYRLKNNMVIRNPLAFENIRRYLFATKLTHSAVAIIQYFYKTTMEQNEFGYLMLYFNFALDRYISTKKITIALISGRGRAETVMYFNEIKSILNLDRYNITLLESLPNSPTNIDILVSTYNIKNKLDIPVITIQDKDYLSNLQNIIYNLQIENLDINKYLDKSYSYFNIRGNSKDEILQNIYETFLNLGLINKIPDPNLRFVHNNIGNSIVHLQDLYRICRKKFIFIGVFKKPILWDNQITRILVMIKTKKDGDKDLFALCYIISKWAENKKYVNNILNNPHYEQFYSDIFKVYNYSSGNKAI